MAKKNWQDIGNVKQRQAAKQQQQQADAQYRQQQTQPQGPQYLPPRPDPYMPDDPRLTLTDRGRTYYSPNYQYTQATDSGLLIRQRHNAVWLNNPLQPKGAPRPAFATLKDAASGNANWTDVESTQREQVLKDPKFYETGQINNYPAWQQQQILADPSFKWERLPTWQKYYYQLSSSPSGMGAAQGALLGLGGGPVGSAIGSGIGAALGWAAGKSGYDPAKGVTQQKGITAKAFGAANYLAETAEQALGIGVQAIAAATDPNTSVKDVFTREGWEAGRTTLEVLGPAVNAALKGNGKLDWGDALKLAPPIYFAERLTDLMLHPEKYKGMELILGSRDPLELESTFKERMEEARARIANGDNPREVALDFQNGVMAQLGDMGGQAFLDPLNVLPSVSTAGAGKIADITGNTVAAQAIGQSGGLVEAARTYKTLVQTGQAMVIDPNFKVDTMGALSRWVAGVNADGTIKAGPFSKKGLLDAPTKTGFVEELTSLTPQSRAQIGAGMFYENISALLTRFDDPHEAGKYLKALATSDMETWKELGTRFADSPEFYTVLPALQAYNATALDGIITAWDASAPNRDALVQISNVLGDNPSKLLDDLAAKGTAEQDFQRLTARLQEAGTPEAKQILDDIQAGRFTVDTLKQVVDVFTGDGALPWHPGQWKAMMLDSLGTHFDKWVTDRLMLDQTPEAKSAFFRTAALLKSTQSILLLGASPGYAITNGLSNMVHRAASGVFGYLTPGQINGWMERFGINPARFEEGVGIGGMVEQANTKTGVKSEAQQKAIQGKGHLADAKNKVNQLSRGMPFSKLSSWFEKNEGRQAFTIGMRSFWSQSWRRGVGFRKMDAPMLKAIQSMGIDPNYIYAAIEAGMNQADIEKALFSRVSDIQSRALINDAARRAGITAQQAADLLDKIGVLDELDKHLKGKSTRDGVTAAFRRAERVAQDWLDMQAGEDLKATAEHVAQKVGIEGAAAGLDVVQRVQSNFWDAWMDHYARMGDVFENVTGLEDQAVLSKAIELAYETADREFRRINAQTAANYKGVFDAWGLSGNQDANNVLSAMGQSDYAMKLAYEQMRAIRRQLFEKLKDMDTDQRRMAWGSANEQIDDLFTRAFEAKTKAEKQMGEALGNLYENRYGPAAGEAARRWWADVVKFNQEIIRREKKARAEFKKLPLEERGAAKARYYSTEKIALISEAEVINQNGIQRLERVIRRGKGPATTTPIDQPPAPDQPAAPAKRKGKKDPTAEEVEFLAQAAEERKAATSTETQAREAAVWDAAEQFARDRTPYKRGVLQDKFALLGALKKEEYGGIPDLKGLSDERLTPGTVQRVLERRAEAKASQVEQTVGEAVARARSTLKVPKIGDNTTILKAISELGGISLEQIADITGDTKSRGAPGVFRKKGMGLDQMARELADYGYPIDLNDANDPGGIRQTVDLISRAINKEKIYPVSHSYEAAIEARARAYEAEMVEQALTPEPFNATQWESDYAQAIESGDLTRMYELIGEAPEGTRPDGESWETYVTRTSEEVEARVARDAQVEEIAQMAARAEASLEESEIAADRAMTRNILKEKFQDAFGLTDEQAQGYMELSDAIAGWYERVTGEDGDAFYSRYYNDVVSDGADVDPADLQQGIQVRNQAMTPEAYADYARALVRAGSDELRRAVRNEPDTAGRIALLDAAHKINAKMAVEVAKKSTDVLFQAGQFQTLGGVVSFDASGIKATIHAFEAADFSTLVHENGHIFRRVLSDVAARTDDAQVRADLSTIEEWVGAKPGEKWSRAQEEQFARGFERYIAEGEAPTPKLAKAFKSFMNWMMEIYKLITGSEIDVNLTDEVRQVFGRMLDAENFPDRYMDALTGQLDQIAEMLEADKRSRDPFAEITRMVNEGILQDIAKDTLYQKKRKNPGQLGLFGAGEDLPLFSGTAQRANVEEFTPTQQVRQETLFDMRPQMGEQPRPARQPVPEPRTTPIPEVKARAEDISLRAELKALEDEINAQYWNFTRQARANPPERRLYDRVNEIKKKLGLMSEFYELTQAQVKARENMPASKHRQYIERAIAEGKTIPPEVLKDYPDIQPATPPGPTTLFQEVTQPIGALDAASQYIPHGQVMDEGYRQHVKPLMEAMQATALDQLETRPLDGARDTSPEGQAMLRQYMRQVQNDMATTKLATVRYGEQQRDFAMLNYGKQYGFDRWMQTVYPYELFYTRSLATWAARAIDAPAWFSNYARLRMQQQRYERDIPERLRNKIHIPAPWLPDWMGDGLYIDPLSNLFTPAGFLRPFERMQADRTQQELEAERILQEWAADGSVSENDIQAAINREGPAWERAIAEAQTRRESEIANPMDFFSTMFGPAWYLSAPLNAAGIKVPGISKGDPNKVSPTPMANTVRGIDAVTQGTWAEPIGDIIGLLGKPEEWVRKKLELPTLGEYGEYYTKRQVANMVAEGTITSEQAQLAMLEKQGEIWDQATERVKLELAMRVPTMAALYAGLHEGPGALAQASLPSLFGAGLLPEGELEYRGLKQEWNEAWKKKDMGDATAITAFFEEHPEYEAYLAKGKSDEDLLKSFLIGQIWDGYMAMGPTNQKQARAEMGELFQQAFLDKETRSYEAIDTETLIQWAQQFGKKTPQAINAQPLETPEPPKLDLYSEDVTRISDEFFRQRTENHGDYYELEQGYFDLPKSQRAGYLLKNPELKKYWDFKDKWFKTYPDLEPIFRGQVFKRINTEGWPPGLVDSVTSYAYSGTRLKKGAYKALEQQWILEGRPYDNMNTWLNSQVVPAMLYGGE
jgi:hypothetical protein